MARSEQPLSAEKGSAIDSLMAMTAGLAISSMMVGWMMGDLMFGNDNTGAIKAMMTGPVEAYETRLDSLKDEVKRENTRTDELRNEAREAQVTIATLRDEANNLRRVVEELRAKKA